ncbi:LOW QUALITY PROTEIN: centrosomal protein of 170 kDa protein B [Aplochiton taeniatus]
MSVTSWFLVSSSGTRHRLPREMIFVGREECELMLQSRSVDKQHAVVNYDPATDEHMVKDLGSLNGTFVNDLRIPDQTYITLKLSDVVRFGYDSHVYILERSQHKVPEEALKHEKYSSLLQQSVRALEARQRERQKQQQQQQRTKGSMLDPPDPKAPSATATADAPASRPTPLYGQPSWWGEEEEGEKEEGDPGKEQDHSPSSHGPKSDPGTTGQPLKAVNGSLSDGQGKTPSSYRREPRYFEIPTNELHSRPAKNADAPLHEVPTKDTPAPPRSASGPAPGPAPGPTPPVVQSHASFTIEFDECTPGRMKIKDHVTKFAVRQRKPAAKEAVTTPTEVMSAESKVADWLVQSDVNMCGRSLKTEDVYSTKSDPSLQKTKGHRHEDATHSDSEDPVVNDRKPLRSQRLGRVSPHAMTPPDLDEPLSCSPPGSQSPPSLTRPDPQQAFVIEFFDDNPRKKRSQSFTNVTAQPDGAASLKSRMEKTRRGPAMAPASPPSTPPTQRSGPATQQYTIALKGSGTSGPQRAGSLRREKTEDRISTGYSSRSSSSSMVKVRPFASVGRRSKLAHDFAAEFLRNQTRQSSSLPPGPPPGPPPAPPPTSSPPGSSVDPPAFLHSPSDSKPAAAPPQPRASSPVRQPVPLKPPLMKPLCPGGVGPQKSPRGPRPEEDDTLSDAGTYTIEGDVPDKEVEEARSNIDQVFGVEDRQQHRGTSSTGHTHNLVQVEPGGPLLPGAPKWMSRWASLADSYTDSGPGPGLFGLTNHMERPAGGRVIHQTTLTRTTDSQDTEASRTRRVLPQLPPGEPGETASPSVHLFHSPCSPGEGTARQGPPPRQPAADRHHLGVRDEVEPDSLSDASRSDDGSAAEARRGSSASEKPRPSRAPPGLPAKAPSFYISSAEPRPDHGHGAEPRLNTPKAERKRAPPPAAKAYCTATLTKLKGQESGRLRPDAPAPSLGGLDGNGPASSGSPPASLVRQESFTKDRPSNARLPNISSPPDPEASGQDTHSFLRETESVLAVLEAKLQTGAQDTTSTSASGPVGDSPSGESDVDTSSTVSHRSSSRTSAALGKRTLTSGLHRERSSLSSVFQSSARDRQAEKGRPQGLDAGAKADPGRRLVGLRRGAGKRASVDLGDDPQERQALAGLDRTPVASDQEATSRPASHRKHASPLQKEEAKPSSRGAASTTATSLAVSNSLSAPRDTRASMLRRARILGDASDNELAEAERAPEAKAPAGEEAADPGWDLLAMPRKRAGSFTATVPSDTEPSTPTGTGRTAGFSNRSTEVQQQLGPQGLRGGAPPGSAEALRGPPGPVRRQKGSDYTSTSDEEYDSNQSTPKHKRSHPPSANHSPRSQPRSQSRAQPLVALRPKPRSRDSEDEGQEGSAFQNWTSHSAEIARLSQDLAKDLAILAREIHDVAGETDPQPTSTSSETSHQEPATEVGATSIQAADREPDQKNSDHQQILSQRKQDQIQVTVDNLALDPVSQVSMAIRDNTEQLAGKIKVLFHNKMDAWEEIEAKLDAESDFPELNTSNKEITSILKELRRVQRQLEVINTVMEHGGPPEPARTPASGGSTSAGLRPSRQPVRDWRTRGGGPPAGAKTGAAASSDGESYVV